MAEPGLASLFLIGLPIVVNMLLAWAQKTTIDRTADSQKVTIQFTPERNN